MSRNNKAHRKAKQKKKQSRSQLSRQTSSAPRLNDVSTNAARLIERGSWQRALEILQDYDEAHPEDPNVLGLLAEVYHHFRAYGKYCQVVRRHLALEPDNRLLHLMLGGGYLGDFRPVSALLTFRDFIGRWPGDPLADGAREEIERLEPVVENVVLKNFPGVGEERLKLAAENEEIIACLGAGEYVRVLEIAEPLLARIGEFSAVMNNLGEACFQLGDADRAIATARRVAELESGNFHALANLTRYLFFSGRPEAAREVVARLRTVQSDRKDIWIKKCEALATLGDDEGVLTVFAEAEADGVGKATSPDFAVLFHLAAVAFSRRGDCTQADRWWRAALKISTNMDVVRGNLADASKPAEKRHGAWYFAIGYWGCSKAIAGLRERFGKAGNPNADTIAQMVNDFVADHPEFVKLLPGLLDRGDPFGRELAWRVAMKLNTPEVIDALLNFCTSQRGPDWMRVETAEHLSQIGALPGPEVRMWLDGKWQTGNMFGFEITTEPRESAHSEQVLDWIYDGLMAIRAGNGSHAEQLFQKCIEFEGESPDVLNNLAISYNAQGRTREAVQLLRQVHQRWPDYFFGRISMASQAIIDGDFEQARDYLAPLCRRKKLHISEFAALANVQIQFALEAENLDSARHWLEMWQEIDPDNPELEDAGLRVALLASEQPGR